MAKGEKFKKFFKNIIKPFLRGALKSLPFGGAVVELSDNIKAEIALNKNEVPARGSIDENGQMKAPHNWGTIIVNIIIAGVIVYAFVTKSITIDEVINFLNQLKTQG